MLYHLFHLFKCRSSLKFLMAIWYSIRSISDIFRSTWLKDGLVDAILLIWIACLTIIVIWLIISEELSSILSNSPNNFSSSLKTSLKTFCKSFQIQFTNSHSINKCLNVSICSLQNVQFGVSLFILNSNNFVSHSSY